jgi:hypothetical protein
VIKY